LGVLDINPDHRYVRAGGDLHNARYKGQYDALKERRARESLCHLGKSNRKREAGVPVGNLQKRLGLRQVRLYLSNLTKTSSLLQPLLNYLQFYCRDNRVGKYRYTISCLVHRLNSKLRTSTD